MDLWLVHTLEHRYACVAALVNGNNGGRIKAECGIEHEALMQRGHHLLHPGHLIVAA